MTSRKLAIDASIVHATGETQHPVSSACRKCLLDIYTICHHAVLTDEVSREWSGHLSRFSRKWRVAMDARKKLDRIPGRAVSLQMNSFSPPSKAAIKKDLHLLEAANAGDRIIVTLDEAVQKALEETPKGMKVLGSFKWINPVHDGSAPLESL